MKIEIKYLGKVICMYILLVLTLADENEPITLHLAHISLTYYSFHQHTGKIILKQ